MNCTLCGEPIDLGGDYIDAGDGVFYHPPCRELLRESMKKHDDWAYGFGRSFTYFHIDVYSRPTCFFCSDDVRHTLRYEDKNGDHGTVHICDKHKVVILQGIEESVDGIDDTEAREFMKWREEQKQFEADRFYDWQTNYYGR